ncbi:ABC transporter ATP-binding protein [Streptococcus dysgalactiae]|uniref:ABC transporter ATP-binding protein n=1 Tax=Streptococcus dysgalactiae subsp. equisimilis TaxID=119602 RepID=A0AB38XYS2_STREQ|nr:ABC transporter ATP-binding protein [Streptococcus dysgalactiae]QQY17241.1 ABC transporter ATP-binding protein [Streptococcus dysgalactiae]TYK97662.1 ABC transporter ATP-binding protein [Streptococcus dysgalactiae]WEQ80689.1 ABC transporter ATP-binding protein/permease [Streptococcus dysgalactiae subsp. equisimilis]WHM78361.1 ABC transporter ATP-binding protein [Streptococcus dysgalactiae subsp. equisimilis]WJD51565.1 ABC transporter ATP-binding protein [Streptococcus dysgalactiae subsp. eq
MKFIKLSFKLAGQYKNRLKAGMLLIFLQNASVLFGFFALFLAFGWMNEITVGHIWTIFGVLFASFLFNFLTGWAKSGLSDGVFFGIFKDYRLAVGEKLKKAPMGYFAEQSLSRIMAAFTNVMKSLENYSAMSIDFAVSGISISFFLLIGMLGVNIKNGILTLICLIFIWLCVLLMTNQAKKEIAREHTAITKLGDALVDSISGIPVLRSFPLVNESVEEKIHSKLKNASEELRLTQVHFEMVFVIYARIFSTIINLSSLLVTLFSCYLYTKGEVLLPQALTVSAAGFMIFGGLKQLENAAILMVKNPANMQYLEEVLDIPEISDGTLEVMKNNDIVFDKVNFAYDKRNPVLKDLSFTISQGSRTAIVGPSGSGKTTIINLISRFYDVDSGEIRLGNKDIRDYKVESLLKNLSLVFQDVYLFRDTIENNIRFANPDASHEEVVEAAKKARCHNFIMELPDGYNTMVGEGGSSLSGGEKQRISIARALLKNAPIILLDEATSSVDPENEYEILAAIEELSKGHTVISIAHRLSTVKKADQILVIDRGTLVQAGNHSDLICKEGIYSSFIQARERAANWTL